MHRGRAMVRVVIHLSLSLTADRAAPVPDKFVWDTWHTKWHWNRPFSKYFSFPFSHS